LAGDFDLAGGAEERSASSAGLVTFGELTSTITSAFPSPVSSFVVGDVGAADWLVEVWAPPVLLKFMSGTVGRGTEPPPAEPLWPEVVCCVTSDSSVGADVAGLSPDAVDPDEDSELDPAPDDESEPSSARATPSAPLVASAAPTPSAMASAPMRPTCLA
jgi:hypothetical protein